MHLHNLPASLGRQSLAIYFILVTTLLTSAGTLLLRADEPRPLDADTTVSVLNRSARVKADGTWRIDNIPANFGPVRVRSKAPVKGAFTLQDDDRATKPKRADTSLVAKVFKPAYVEPLFDGAGEIGNTHNQDDVTFHANIELISSDVNSVLAAGRQSPDFSDEYWSIYVLGCFQGQRRFDNDPDGETGLEGGVTAKTGAARRPRGTFIYHETLHDSGTTALEAKVTVHEIGHYFNGNGTRGDGHELDTSLMAPGTNATSGEFNSETINRIRSWKK